VCVTADRNAGEAVVRAGLEYSTTTSPASRPNARVARFASCWLWLSGALNPPAVCTLAKMVVPHTPPSTATSKAISRISRRRR
jgi:hypothetical protein